jgi:hypothetical protein
MATNNAANVSTGKPKVGGAIFVAPKGTALPTDATSPLSEAFVNLGYASEDGLVNGTETDTNDTNAWGGDTVLSVQTSYKETFTVNLIETKEAVLAQYYGPDNVTVGNDGNIQVRHNSKQLPEQVAVVEVVLADGRIKRTVVPAAQVSDRSGEISYTDGDAIAYPIVWNAKPHATWDGDTARDFIAAVDEPESV